MYCIKFIVTFRGERKKKNEKHNSDNQTLENEVNERYQRFKTETEVNDRQKALADQKHTLLKRL